MDIKLTFNIVYNYFLCIRSLEAINIVNGVSYKYHMLKISPLIVSYICENIGIKCSILETRKLRLEFFCS